MEQLADAIASAQSIVNMGDYATKVKQIVGATLEQLDPGVRLKDTGYFNHSAVPDFEATWPRGSGQERGLFIRRSIAEIAAGRDVTRLASQSPIILAVGPGDADDQDYEALLERDYRAHEKGDPLIASSPALDSLAKSVARSPGSSPLSHAVSSAILPHGRGILDADRVAAVTAPSENLSSVLEEILTPDAFSGIQGMSALISAARSGAGAEIPTGTLSVADARSVLPWILTAEGVRQDDSFWKSIAERVSLETLEACSDLLEGIDLTILARQATDEWAPRRGYLGTGDFEAGDGWYLANRRLSLKVGRDVMRFSADGRSLKGRGTSSSATWDAVREGLRQFQLVEVRLRGVDRSIRVDANESQDLSSDVDQIVDSISDNYFIDAVATSIAVPNSESVQLRIDFGESLAVADMPVKLHHFVTALSRVVSYRSPIASAPYVSMPTEAAQEFEA